MYPLVAQGFALLHNSYRWTTFFQVHFTVWSLVNLSRCVYVSRDKRLSAAKVLLKRAFIATVLAAFFWMVRHRIVAYIRCWGYAYLAASFVVKRTSLRAGPPCFATACVADLL